MSERVWCRTDFVFVLVEHNRIHKQHTNIHAYAHVHTYKDCCDRQHGCWNESCCFVYILLCTQYTVFTAYRSVLEYIVICAFASISMCCTEEKNIVSRFFYVDVDMFVFIYLKKQWKLIKRKNIKYRCKCFSPQKYRQFGTNLRAFFALLFSAGLCSIENNWWCTVEHTFNPCRCFRYRWVVVFIDFSLTSQKYHFCISFSCACANLRIFQVCFCTRQHSTAQIVIKFNSWWIPEKIEMLA